MKFFDLVSFSSSSRRHCPCAHICISIRKHAATRTWKGKNVEMEMFRFVCHRQRRQFLFVLFFSFGFRAKWKSYCSLNLLSFLMLPFKAIFPFKWDCWRVVSFVRLQFRLKHAKENYTVYKTGALCTTHKLLDGVKKKIHPIIVHSSDTISLSSIVAKTDGGRFRCAFESHLMINEITRKSIWIVNGRTATKRKASKCRALPSPTNESPKPTITIRAPTFSIFFSNFLRAVRMNWKTNARFFFFAAPSSSKWFMLSRRIARLNGCHFCIYCFHRFIMFIMFASRCMSNPIRAGFTVCNRMLVLFNPTLNPIVCQSIPRFQLRFQSFTFTPFELENCKFCLLLCRHTHRLTVILSTILFRVELLTKDS